MKKSKMQILFAIFIILISFLPVIIIDRQSYTMVQLILGNVKMPNPIMPIQVPGILFFMTPIFYLIHLVFLVKDYTDRYEDFAVYLSILTTVLAIIFIILSGIGTKGSFAIWVWIRMLTIFISYSFIRVYESFHDFKKTEKEQKLKEKREREISKAKRVESTRHMKRIKKSAYLKKVIWKIYKSNMRNSVLLITGAVISSAFLFTTIAVYEMFSDLQKGNIPVVGDELSLLLKDSIILIGLISIFILALSLKIYVKSRIKDYGLLVTLGMRDRVLRFFIAIEYSGTLLVGLLIGILVGTLLTIGFQGILHSMYPYLIFIEIPSIKTYFITCFCIILVFLLSAVVNQEFYVEKRLGASSKIPISREKMPRMWLEVRCIIGILIMVISSYIFSKRVWLESIYIILFFLLGCYMAINAGGALLLKRYRKKGKRYYKKLLFLQEFYSRFKTQRRSLFIVYILHFLLITYFSVRISANLPLDRGDALFPYDYVCLGQEEDQKTFKEFGKELSKKSEIIPMVRITVPSASKENAGSTQDIRFQGQNIGISESSYNKLTGRKLGLKNKEIYISFQQDESEKAHLLDFSVLSGSPRIRFGMPEFYMYFKRDDVFESDYKVIGEERRIIIGNFAGGMQENIVVFSDKYFKSIYSTGNGPSVLGLFNINKSKEKEAATQFSNYSKAHKQYSEYDSIIQPVYEKEPLENNTLLAHMLNMLEYTFVVVLLLISILYAFIVKVVSELKYTQARMKQLKYLGIKRKMHRKILSFENNIMTIMPLLLGVVISIPYIFITLKLRYFIKIEQQQFWKYEILFIGIYILINLIVAFIMSRIMILIGDKED